LIALTSIFLTQSTSLSPIGKLKLSCVCPDLNGKSGTREKRDKEFKIQMTIGRQIPTCLKQSLDKIWKNF